MTKNTTAVKSGPAHAKPSAKSAPENQTVLVTNSVCSSSGSLVREAVTINLSKATK